VQNVFNASFTGFSVGKTLYSTYLKYLCFSSLTASMLRPDDWRGDRIFGLDDLQSTRVFEFALAFSSLGVLAWLIVYLLPPR
jgi:hypothetical protein